MLLGASGCCFLVFDHPLAARDACTGMACTDEGQTFPHVRPRNPITLLEPSKPSAQQYIAKKNTVPLPEDLGKLIEMVVALMQQLGLTGFVKAKQGRGDLGSLEFNHPAARILKQYKKHGVPVKLTTPAWAEDKIKAKLHQSLHKSCHKNLEFLQEERIDMINKKQWAILPYEVAKELPGLRLSPPGVVPQREHWPQMICDYSY